MNSNIDEQIAYLTNGVIKMASLCERSLDAVEKLIKDGSGKLSDIEALGENIEKASKDIGQYCMMMLLRRHPVAKDLRSVSSALRIVNDLERIGNNSYDLAEVLSYVQHRHVMENAAIGHMIKMVSEMLSSSIDAYVHADKAKAQAVIDSDDLLDNAFLEAKARLIDMIREGENGDEDVPDVLLAAKYLERMGDHAVNLSKQLLWSVSGDEYK